MKKLFYIFICLFIFLSTVSVFSQAPRKINYQSLILDDQDEPITQTISITFEIYNSSTGGTQLWSETHSVTPNEGYINIVLGETSTLNIDFDQPLWLQITVDGAAYSRTPFTATPYSMQALEANHADQSDYATMAASVENNSITQEKLAPGIKAEPQGSAGGDLTGTYPNPKIADGAILNKHIKDAEILPSKLSTADGQPFNIMMVDVNGQAQWSSLASFSSLLNMFIQGTENGQMLFWNDKMNSWQIAMSNEPEDGQVLQWDGSMNSINWAEDGFQVPYRKISDESAPYMLQLIKDRGEGNGLMVTVNANNGGSAIVARDGGDGYPTVDISNTNENGQALKVEADLTKGKNYVATFKNVGLGRSVYIEGQANNNNMIMVDPNDNDDAVLVVRNRANSENKTAIKTYGDIWANSSIGAGDLYARDGLYIGNPPNSTMYSFTLPQNYGNPLHFNGSLRIFGDLEIRGDFSSPTLDALRADVNKNSDDIKVLRNDVDYLNNVVPTIAYKVDANSNKIDLNTNKINSNTGSINTNAGRISSNLSQINSNTNRITQNENDIRLNTSSINTNTSNISQNSSQIQSIGISLASMSTSIATNASAIEDNADDIATLNTNFGLLSTNVNTNTSNIADNTGSIAYNLSRIETNTTNIGLNSDLLSATPGTASPGKALIVDNTNNIGDIGLFDAVFGDFNQLYVQNLQLGAGEEITKFSSNTSLGNSNSKVPTQKAVKTYVDDKVAVNTTNIGLNSDLLSATPGIASPGKALIVDQSNSIDNIGMLYAIIGDFSQIYLDNLQLGAGEEISEFSGNSSLGNSNQKVPTQKAVKTYVDDKVAVNTTNIATNTSNIATNTSNISANTSNISTNTSNISANTSNIATNTSNISANTSNIATNTSNISTNTSNIATNTSNISTNTSNISTNTSNISTNTSNIAANSDLLSATPGIAEAGKALIVDQNKDISYINYLGASEAFFDSDVWAYSLTLSGGGYITEFSSNTSLGNNDNIVPTQKAVKTYVDNSIVPGWALTGNGGTTTSNFLGTTDKQSLEVKVNSNRIMLFEHVSGGANNIIGGYKDNSSSTGVEGSVIAGGGKSGAPNTVSGNWSAIGGGAGNNTIGDYSNIGGGDNNTTAGNYSAIPGGSYLKVGAGSFGFRGSVNGRPTSQYDASAETNTFHVVDAYFHHNPRMVEADFMIDGTSKNLFYGDAAANRVGIGTNAPQDKLHVTGGIIVGPTNNPSLPQPGAIQWDGYNFLGYDGSTWKMLDFNSMDTDWTEETTPADHVRIGQTTRGISTYDGVLYGSNANTHVNLGYGTDTNASQTGTSGFDYSYATISGGFNNKATANNTVIGGGSSNQATQDATTIGGGLSNIASGSMSTIAGGNSNNTTGSESTISGGNTNTAAGDYSSVGGGRDNAANAQSTTVSGGDGNIAGGTNSTISGGYYNETISDNSTISGGYSNTTNDLYNSIGGGSTNSTSGLYSTVSGGGFNSASGATSTVGGGGNNNASGTRSVISGGFNNISDGELSAIPGGSYLTVGARSFGFRGGIGSNPTAKFDASGETETFHIIDTKFHHNMSNNSDADFHVSGMSDFLIFADAGADFVGIGTNIPQQRLSVDGGISIGNTTIPSAGAIRWTGMNFEGFNGGSWIPLDASGGVTNIDGLTDGISSDGSSLFLGTGAGANDDASFNSNTGVGVYTLNANITGLDNTAVGNYALYSSTSSANTAIGGSSLKLNTTGSSNTAVGAQTLAANSTGSFNVAFGAYASSNSTGSYNASFGYQALYNNTTGAYNTAIGNAALLNNTNSYNVAVGYRSLYENGIGQGNNAFGYEALDANITGSYNLGLGWRAGDNITSGSRNIIIGYDLDAPIATGNDQLNIGGIIQGDMTSGSEAVDLIGDVSINSAYTLPSADGTSGYALTTDGAGTVSWTDVSDADWTEETTPAAHLRVATAQKGIAGYNAVLYGNMATTHVNLGFGAGVNASETGESGYNYGYITVSGGNTNIATASNSTISGGSNNTATGNSSTIGGGQTNSASGISSVIAGGSSNSITADYGVVGGGSNNTASAQYAIVAAGNGNTASNDYAVISGGGNNQATAIHSVIVGGASNNANGDYSSVKGGRQNTASGDYSVSGGYQNITSGNRSVIPGGSFLTVGPRSFGFRGGIGSDPTINFDASTETETFHIIDTKFHHNTSNNTGADFHVSGTSDYLIYADAGGDVVGIGTNVPQQKLSVNGGINIGNTTIPAAGSIRWNGTNFEGHDGASWVLLDQQTGATSIDELSDGITHGFSDLYLGSYSGFNEDGTNKHNTGVGSYALYNTVNGRDNVALGFWSLYNNTSGQANTALGLQALFSNDIGSNNIAIGYKTGANITSGSNNIIIGHNLNASAATVTDELNIGGIIQGDMTSGSEAVDLIGDVTINSAYTFPGTDGTSGQVLQTDGSGTLSWANAGGSGWGLTGNAGTTPGTNFIGTTDANAFEIYVDNTRAIRVQPPPGTGDAANIIAGYQSNTIGGTNIGSAILSGGAISPTHNEIAGNHSVIAGGNEQYSSNDYTFIGGGTGNSTYSMYGTIAGGQSNTVNGVAGAVGGGSNNTASTSAAVPGGDNNLAAGDYSFAAGRYATAAHPGVFIWADGTTTAAYSSTADNQFIVKAAGGVGLGTNSPNEQLHVNGAVVVGASSASLPSDGTIEFDGIDTYYGYFNSQWNAFLTNANGWATDGNSGTIPGDNYIGTNDATAFQIHVNSTRVMRFEPNPTSPMIIGGHENNSVNVNGWGTVIVGGGNLSDPNIANMPYSFIGAGVGNNSSGSYSAIVAGNLNAIMGDNSFVGAGVSNNANGLSSVVGGGEYNSATGDYSVIAGGTYNSAAGANSFAAGTYAYADNDGSFVWADATTASGYSSTANNQFIVKAAGGVGLGTNSPNEQLHVNGAVVVGASGASTPVAGTVQWFGGNLQYHDGASWNTISAATGWGLNGNAGTTPGTNYIGTSDNQDFVIKVNAEQAMRFSHSGVFDDTPNIIGGYNLNNVTATKGATIAGGGAFNEINSISANFGAILGGMNNSVAGENSSVGGGWMNSIGIGSTNSFIGSGVSNSIDNSATYGVISGGQSNVINANSGYGSIGGGYSNVILGDFSVIPGGSYLKVGGGSFGFRGQIASPTSELDMSASTNSFIIENASFSFNVGDNQTAADFQVAGGTDDNMIYGDASADKVGIGTNTPNSKLSVNGSMSLPFTEITNTGLGASLTLTDAHYCVVGNCNNIGNVDITLPPASSCMGRIYVIKAQNNNPGTYDVIITAASGDMFDDLSDTYTIANVRGSVTIMSDGSGIWHILDTN